ncbi:hypothetical protein HYW76_01340 [Candidatus Pacearchaeota archaeon]|nr:hypothetical protein [Candidatus Pacearchaeota archaeon]
MELDNKAKDYFIVARISEKIGKFDVACTNYFKSLAAVNDFVLAKKELFPKDHNERFFMLKENEPFLYKITSSLFLTYRRTYTKNIDTNEALMLKEKVKEAFEYAKIAIPSDSEIEKYFKR